MPTIGHTFTVKALIIVKSEKQRIIIRAEGEAFWADKDSLLIEDYRLIAPRVEITKDEQREIVEALFEAALAMGEPS